MQRSSFSLGYSSPCTDLLCNCEMSFFKGPPLFFSIIFSLFLIIHLFWLHQVFVAARGIFHCSAQPLQVQRADCRVHRFHCSAARGILVPRPGVELGPLHCKVDSQPLDHQGSPLHTFPLSLQGPGEIHLFQEICPWNNCLKSPFYIRTSIFRERPLINRRHFRLDQFQEQ